MTVVITHGFVEVPGIKLDGLSRVRQCLGEGWRWTVRLLNKHTDLISSGGILAITTCLLASKIFKSIPVLLPRIARVVFDFGGIIWLNVQMRDLIKSGRDLIIACKARTWWACVETAGKVFLKTVNVLLTCAIFASSVIAAIGFPHITSALNMAMRPLSLTTLGLTIATDFRDYFANDALLREMTALEKHPESTQRILKVMVCFLENVMRTKKPRLEEWPEERRLAERIIRQLDTFTLETFQEQLALKKKVSDARIEALKLFFAVKDSMQNKQAGTKANLNLTAMGYVSMALCRAFPDSVIEMSSRWGMSVLYTDDLVGQKLFQSDLESTLAS